MQTFPTGECPRTAIDPTILNGSKRQCQSASCLAPPPCSRATSADLRRFKALVASLRLRIEHAQKLTPEGRFDEVIGQKYRPQQASDPDTDLIQRIAARGGAKARQHIDGAGVTAVGGGDQMHPPVPVDRYLAQVQAGLANRFQYLRHLVAAR